MKRLGLFFRGRLIERRPNVHFTSTKVLIEGGACPFIAKRLV